MTAGKIKRFIKDCGWGRTAGDDLYEKCVNNSAVAPRIKMERWRGGPRKYFKMLSAAGRFNLRILLDEHV